MREIPKQIASPDMLSSKVMSTNNDIAELMVSEPYE